MNKRKAFFILLIIFIVIFGFIYKKGNHSIYHNSATSGLVVNKNINPYRITLRELSENTKSAEEVEIEIENENVWNLIEKDRSYFATYFWQDNEMPKLGQIEINDDFKEIYKDALYKD